MFGEKHRALTKWLTDEWWSKGPPVCVISGFPGTGKTEIAVQTMNVLREARSELPIAFFNCVESKSNQADDFLLTITEELAAEQDREPLERLERGEDVTAIFSRLLAPPRLIVADEAQRLLVGSTGAMPTAMASFLERWSQTVGARGRLLLLASREFDFAKWSGLVEFRRVGPLESDEAKAFLRASLKDTGRTEAVPEDRMTDVVSWLGCNPRALKLMVSALARESLDDLIGVATEAWEARDRNVSPELLREFEEVILKRAEERLGERTRVFLHRISVLRQPAENRALHALRPDGGELAPLRDELLARFMLELRRYRYEMHPVLRDTVRVRMTPVERRRAHLAAGRYYAAPFRARRTLGTAEKLGARFIEARYHFTLAESETDLDDISQRFEAHYRTRFGPWTPIPTDPEERDEQIALLSSLLQARGAKGLEHHLARLLVARDRPGDAERALPHARRATGPQSPASAWVLRIRLEARIFGAAKAAQVAREGATLVPPHQSLSSLYQTAGEILSRDGKSDEAVEFLRQGLKKVDSLQSLAELYGAIGEILAQAGNLDKAIELLREAISELGQRQGVNEPHNEQSLCSLYTQASAILMRDNKPDNAIELLRQGIAEMRSAQTLANFNRTISTVFLRNRDPKKAIESLLEGMAKMPAGQPRDHLGEQAIYIAAAENSLDMLPISALGPRQIDLLAIVSAIVRDNPERAARLGTEALPQAGESSAIFIQTAFAWLLAGEPGRADETLRRHPRLNDVSGSPVTWLRAFIALERGISNEAKRLLSIYLGGLDSKDAVNRRLLLWIWDISPDTGPNLALYFPRLPPQLTGFTHTIVRHQYGGPILKAERFLPADEAKIAEPAFEALARPPVQPFDPVRVLIAMQPDRWRGLYVLGCYDKTKTVYVQQCRALTLIHALFDAGELHEGSRLGVIGGGAAGVTAAAAAARKGAKVTLFERAEHLLPLQRQNTKRYIHPHLFDWPASGSINPRAELPLLGWRADRSNAVAAEIGRGFEEVVARTGNIHLRLGVGIQDIEQIPSSDETRRVQILGAEGEVNEIVDVAIIAVGFGIERRNRLGIDSPGYWEDDGLEQALGASPERPQRILVSGAGDGALIDLLRGTIRDFRHEDIVALLPEGDVLRKLEDDLRENESRARRMSLIADAQRLNLQQMYGGLTLGPAFLDQVRKKIRSDTEVWFNFTSAGRYTLSSSVLNRFLVSVLVGLGAVKPKLARLEESAVTRRASGGYAIAWLLGDEPQIFDRAIIRHGPPSDFLGEVFPKLEVACAPLRGKLRDLDLSGSLDDVTRAYFAQ